MEDLFNWPPSWATLLYLPALFVAYTVHELAHATMAFALGDTSQVERHRLSFNPLRHVSWLGMLLFLLVGLPWAKPLWADPSRFRLKEPGPGHVSRLCCRGQRQFPGGPVCPCRHHGHGHRRLGDDRRGRVGHLYVLD